MTHRRRSKGTGWITSPLLFDCCRGGTGRYEGWCLACRRWARHGAEVAARRAAWIKGPNR